MADLDAIVRRANVEKEEDLYGVLGCDELSSTEQINAEFKARALLCHPDKSDEPDAVKTFMRLQNARDVLSDPEKRKKYDLWRRSGLDVPFSAWLEGRMERSMHWAYEPKKKRTIEEASHEKQPTSKNEKNDLHVGKETFRQKTNSKTLEKFRKYQI
ncbi:dnaJ homolog subfamily C member 12-like [Oscarella lobularis]|uniref:dnaJ homolog subfamily C member 12-like n=1 Tax=Oscarella lobularis TaxID=121494 RepID=UPI003313CBB4